MSKDLYFATEGRFVKRDNKYYSLGGFTNELWENYLPFFNHIYVFARVSHDASIPVSESNLASSDRISFIELPYYVGVAEYLKVRKQLRKDIYNAIKPEGVYLLRLPGTIGGNVIDFLRKKNIDYYCEVVGDPWGVFSKGSIKGPLRIFLRYYSTYKLKQNVKNSKGALYVTNAYLQGMYPVKEGALSVGASDIQLEDKDFVSSPKSFDSKQKEYTIISVGSLAQMYKSPDVVLNAIKVLNESGIKIKLIWVGDGVFKEDMVKYSEELDIKEQVSFVGGVPHSEVVDYLKDSDFFILASRTEGLPRAMVEAMAQGLPCIGTKVGGIPELIDKEVLVHPNSVEDIVKVIKRLVNDPEFANSQAKRNLQESLNYKREILSEKRNSFYHTICEK